MQPPTSVIRLRASEVKLNKTLRVLRGFSYFFGSASNTRVTNSVMYGPEPRGLGPRRTTTTSRDGITIVYCPM